jgi:4-amino-4-deoxy-L-arabinose transferase-like glycosyltransferase
MAARSILETGLPILPNGKLYLKGVPFSYLATGFGALAGSTDLGGRILSALSTLLGGLVVFQLGSRLMHERAGLLASVLFLFHPWTIELARWGRFYVMAGVLLALALLYCIRFEESRARRDLAIAGAWLAAACILYPFSVWGGVAFGVCWIVQRVRTQPERGRATIAWAVAATGLAAAAILMIDHYAQDLIRVTGFYSKFSLDEFTGFAPVFMHFYFTDLFPFSASVVLLLLQVLFMRDSLARARLLPVIGLLVLTLGGVLLVTFVHLQKAPRYLLPILPLTLVAAVMAWSSLIDRLGPARSRLTYAGLAVIALAGYGAYGAYGIPFKHHGDPYLNSSFAPSPRLTRYRSYAGPARYVAQRAEQGDMFICSAPQFFTYYAKVEPQYTFMPGYSWSKTEPYHHMKRTRVLSKPKALEKVIKDARREGRRVWIAVNDDSKAIKSIEKIKKSLKLTRVWQDPEDEAAVVYAVPPP